MEGILELFYPLRNDWTNLKILNFSFKVIPKKRDFFHVNQIIPSRIETYWYQLMEKDHLGRFFIKAFMMTELTGGCLVSREGRELSKLLGGQSLQLCWSGWILHSQWEINRLEISNYFCDLWEKKSHSPLISFHIYKILEIF